MGVTAEDRSSEGSPGGRLGTGNQQQVLAAVWAAGQGTGAEVSRPSRRPLGAERAPLTAAYAITLATGTALGKFPKNSVFLFDLFASFQSGLSVVRKRIHLLALAKPQRLTRGHKFMCTQ